MNKLRVLKSDENYDKVETLCISILIILIYAVWMIQIRTSPDVVNSNDSFNKCFAEASMMSFMAIAYLTYNRKVFGSNLVVAIAYLLYFIYSNDEVSGDLALCYMLASAIAYLRITKTTNYCKYNWGALSGSGERFSAWLDEVSDNEVEPIKLNLVNTLIIYGFALMIVVRNMTIIKVTEVNTTYDQLGLFIESLITILPLLICLLAVINSYEVQLTRALYHAAMIYSYVKYYLVSMDIAYMYLAFLSMVLMGICIYSMYYKAVKDDLDNVDFNFETIKIKDIRRLK